MTTTPTYMTAKMDIVHIDHDATLCVMIELDAVRARGSLPVHQAA